MDAVQTRGNYSRFILTGRGGRFDLELGIERDFRTVFARIARMSNATLIVDESDITLAHKSTVLLGRALRRVSSMPTMDTGRLLHDCFDESVDLLKCVQA